MSTVTPMPKFAGASALSLTSLQRMADAITHLRDGVASAPAPQARAAAVPGMAFYLPPEITELPVSGQVYTPEWNEPGLIAEAWYSKLATAPSIVEGVLRLPLAENADYPTECEGETVSRWWPGALTELTTAGNIRRPQVRAGVASMPLAQTAWADDCDAGATPGVVYAAAFAPVEAPHIAQGVITLPYANTEGCEGVATPGVLRDVRVDPSAVDPSIEAGVLILPLGGGAVDLADTATSTVGIVSRVEAGDASSGWRITRGAINVPRAHADACTGTAGVISGIQYSNTSVPMICDGVIGLPFAPRGLVGDCGGLVTWEALRASGGIVSIMAPNASHFGYSAQLTPEGGLILYINRA
jgi:hypothetical protein